MNITNSAKETKRLGYMMAKRFPKNKSVLALKGNLGSGKTTFLQGFAKGLGVKEKILSPTFVLFKHFKGKNRDFYHFDCYRVKGKDLNSLGFKDIISNPRNIVAVEWPRTKLPKAVVIEFQFLDKNKRRIIIKK